MAHKTPHPVRDHAPETPLERARRTLDSIPARLVLSFLIIVSVVPLHELLVPTGILGWIGDPSQVAFSSALDMVFFAVFAPEFLLRAAIFVQQQRKERNRAREGVLLALDLVAVLSFLPLRVFLEMDLGYVRLLRLSRMVLLAGYWGGMVSDLWQIITGRERRYQVIFVLLTGLMLSFAGAVVLYWIAPEDRPGSFMDTLWWAFRQVQDPGNLVQEPAGLLILSISVFLTLAGLLLFSFVIGIGTTAIEELLQRSRTQPLGMRDHSVILGLGPHSHFLVEEFAEIYHKNRRELRSAVLGPQRLRPAALQGLRTAAIRYRQGDPLQVEHLERVDVARAKRIIVLGTDPHAADAGVIATILATRNCNPTADLYPDLEHEANLMAARSAGGPRTHVVGSGSFVGDYIAQNVIYPGIYRLHRQTLTSAGCEIYTYVFDKWELRSVQERTGDEPVDALSLHARAHLEHGVTLLGWFVTDDEVTPCEVEDLEVVLHPTTPTGPAYAIDEQGRVRWSKVRGVFGIARGFESLVQFGKAVVRAPLEERIVDAAPSFDHLELSLPAGPAHRVVVCGYSARVPRVVTELIAFYGPIEVRVLARNLDDLAALRQDITAAIARRFPERDAAVEDSAGGFEFRLPIDGGTARILLLPVAWTNATRLVQDPAVGIEETDVLLFLPGGGYATSFDGQVALECLQLSHLVAAGRVKLKPQFRVVGMIEDPEKGDLLEQRLDDMAGEHREERFTIVASERVRHHFIVQNVFVRGLNAVFLRLFEAGGTDVGRLLPSARGGGALTGDFAPWDLARHMVTGRRLVLIGVELNETDGSGCRSVVLDPRAFTPDHRLAWDEIRALYVLGDGRAILRTSE